MSNDNFLTRWSRRKRTVRVAEAPIESRGEPTDGKRLVPPPSSTGEEPAPTLPGAPAVPAAAESAEGIASPSAAADRRGPEELDKASSGGEPLPRLEDITAESDLSAFLRGNVPEALRNAALRRAWSLDPAIRDYQGPAEYAWDYNTPGAIPGFGAGPGAAISGAADYARRIITLSGQGETENPGPPEEAVATSSIRLDAPRPAAPGNAIKPVSSGAREDGAASDGNPGHPATVPAASSGDRQDVPPGRGGNPAEEEEQAGRGGPRHGGATPR